VVGPHDGLVLSIEFLLIITEMVFGIGKTLLLNLLLYILYKIIRLSSAHTIKYNVVGLYALS
jgi:hypothetical protein